MSLQKYLRLPHTPDCDCSVCWSRRELAKPALSQSTPCDQCRPPSCALVDGRWLVTPRSFCAKHTPSARPPKYWHVIHDSGKPTPYVPLGQSFDLEF
ncbi:hypothetical protein GFL09_01285 [Pseudomonas stutzeri]|uniref:lysogeny maintenance protein PflM n=1 Tax=Stutzerimonas stutzeri TaxID=316 RepID=UPI00190C382E|nr:DUF5447 family protein [Stutzerimonas stutzeri]MBK3866342.1 hypothetical protein [Stutzerimonas stutzeri]